MKVALLEPCDRPGHPLHVDERWDIVRTVVVSEPPMPTIAVPVPAGDWTLMQPDDLSHPVFASTADPSYREKRYRKRVHAPTHVAIGDSDETFESFLAYELIEEPR